MLVRSTPLRRSLFYFLFPFATLYIVFALVGPSSVSADLSSEPVDFVYLYVNGTDAALLQEIANAIKPSSRGKNVANKGRFREWDELRYSIRSVFRFAPWFRHICLILANNSTQIPAWLNLTAKATKERLRIVTHAEIFENLENLPTLSSRAIEASVHRIPGVSTRFVLMNDDFFIFTPLSKRLLLPSNFIHYICLRGGQTAPDERTNLPLSATARELSVQYTSKLLNSRYGYHSRRDDCHAPQVIDVNKMVELQQTFRGEFLFATAAKARSGDTITPRFLYNHWLLDAHRMDGFRVVSRWWALRNALSFGLQSRSIRNRIHFMLAEWLRPQFLATNDDIEDSATNLNDTATAFRNFCEMNFPWRSPVENTP